MEPLQIQRLQPCWWSVSYRNRVTRAGCAPPPQLHAKSSTFHLHPGQRLHRQPLDKNFASRFKDVFCQCRLTHRQTRMVSAHCQCVGVMLLCFLCCGVVAVLLRCSENDFVSCRWAAREHTATARAVSVQRARGRHKRSTSRVLNERDRHKSSECSSRAKCSTSAPATQARVHLAH